MTTRRKHFAVESLSEEGQAIVQRGLEQNLPLERIVDDLKAATGERLSLSALHRWNKWLELQDRLAEHQAAVDTATQLIKAVPDARFITSLNHAVKDFILGKVEELEKESAPELMARLLQLEKMELLHKKVEADTVVAQAERIKAVAAEKRAEAALTQADVAERKVAILEKQLRDVGGKLKEAEGKVRAGRALTVEELKQIREQVFGLVEDAGQDEEGPDASS